MDIQNTIATAPSVEATEGGVVIDGSGGEATRLTADAAVTLANRLLRAAQTDGEVYQKPLG